MHFSTKKGHKYNVKMTFANKIEQNNPVYSWPFLWFKFYSALKVDPRREGVMFGFHVGCQKKNITIYNSSSSPTRVPTSDRDRPSPRLWVPNPHSFRPTRQRSTSMTRDGWYECNRQWARDRHRGHQLINRMGLSVDSCVAQGHNYSLTANPEIWQSPNRMSIRYRTWY